MSDQSRIPTHAKDNLVAVKRVTLMKTMKKMIGQHNCPSNKIDFTWSFDGLNPLITIKKQHYVWIGNSRGGRGCTAFSTAFPFHKAVGRSKNRWSKINISRDELANEEMPLMIE